MFSLSFWTVAHSLFSPSDFASSYSGSFAVERLVARSPLSSLDRQWLSNSQMASLNLTSFFTLFRRLGTRCWISNHGCLRTSRTPLLFNVRHVPLFKFTFHRLLLYLCSVLGSCFGGICGMCLPLPLVAFSDATSLSF